MMKMFYIFDFGDSYTRIDTCQKALTCTFSINTFYFIEVEMQLESFLILGVKNWLLIYTSIWMDFKRFYIEWKKLDAKEYSIYDSIYNRFRNMENKSIEIEIRTLLLSMGVRGTTDWKGHKSILRAWICFITWLEC